MPINRDTFLGCGIQSFNTTLGWGSEPTQLSATLIEDSLFGDVFTPVAPGSVQIFSFNGFIVRGLIQNWKYSQSTSGRVYNVTLTDPRAILENVTLILTNYSGAVSVVSNLVNVYKYWNDTLGFGGSLLNENGTPYKKIRDAASAIINASAATPHGWRIKLGGTLFTINLNGLPILPDDFRIPGDSISLMDFISEVCNAAAADFFFALDVGNVITLHTISRTTQPVFGLLSAYINSLPEVISAETGFEFRNEITSKFMLGAPKQDMYFQSYSDEGTPSDYTDDLIWPYWDTVRPGYPGVGNVVVGSEINDQHYFEQDARFLNLNFPGVVVDSYLMCVGELRAALESQASWEFYLWSRNYENVGDYPTSIWYKNRATNLQLIGNVSADFSKFLGTKPIVLGQLSNFDKKQIERSSLSLNTEHEEEIKRLYEYVRHFAGEYYGRKFMVRIPDINARYDSTTQKTYYNYEPVGYGFLDESTWPTAVSTNYLPADINPLLNENGQIQAYCRFDGAAYLDFTEVSPGDVIYNSAGTSAFVKCRVEPGVYFVDRSTLHSPRAVISLSGPVRLKPIGSGTNFWGNVGQLLTKATLGLTPGGSSITDEEKTNIIQQYGLDIVGMGLKGMAVMPTMAAVPLLSNLDRYGPWGYAGVNGKTEFEIDNDLSPWACGGFTSMNAMAYAKVNTAYSNMLESEFGSFEVPGVPTFDLGAVLIGGGPYVTDIQCSVGQEGVTTRYLLSTWSPRFGVASKLQEERLRKLNRNIQQQKAWNRTIVRKFEQAKPPRDENGYIVLEEKTGRRANHSSHAMIVGENVERPDGSGYYANVMIQPGYLTTAQMHPDAYAKKAACSLDTLFRPFSTNKNLPRNSGGPDDFPLAHFNEIELNAEEPNAYNLNPYKTGFDMGVVNRGSVYPDNLAIPLDGYDGSNDYRALALKGPLVITGYGYDTEGNPVPNLHDPVWNSSVFEASGYSPTHFHPEYLSRPNLWPVGPLDARWDYDRQIWVAGGEGGCKIVQILNGPSGDFPNQPGTNVYYAREYTATFNNQQGMSVFGSGVHLSGTNNYFYVGNFRSNIVVEGQFYEANKIKGKYYIDNQAVFL